MTFSVVTVNWNSRDDLRACLSSLATQTYVDLEVLVVDNASSDGSAEMVRSLFPQFTLLQQSQNLGFAEGCNVGIAHSTGGWIALLNNDAVAEADWAEKLVAATTLAPPSCGMLQSLMLFQRTPPTVNSTGIRLSRLGSGRDRGEGEPPPERGRRWEPIFCPTCGAAALRRSMLDAIKLSTGYFDQRHFCYYEDLDLGWRARLAGFDALYVPDSIVRHKYHGTTARMSRAWLVELATTNRVRTLLKNASWRFMTRSLLYTVSQFFRMIFICGPAAAPKYFTAARDSLRLRPEVERTRRIPRRAIERQWVE
jgi:GT2 family glycosyltransferase